MQVGNFNTVDGSRIYPSKRVENDGRPRRPLPFKALLSGALILGGAVFVVRHRADLAGHFAADSKPAGTVAAVAAATPAPTPEDIPPRVSADSHTIARG